MNYDTRVFCKCGWSYKPSNGNPSHGPAVCPKCGHYRGTLPHKNDLEGRGWMVDTVTPIYKKQRWLFVFSRTALVGYKSAYKNKDYDL